ncbi:MAG: hypothetical protein HOP29_11450 [Phycisphaerales bacterium]|nr:hypothetical protein [Phycisphaerales bacterium]
MKTTTYFESRRRLPDRTDIPDSWIEHVVRNPVVMETQSDGRIRKWGRIDDAGGRYLRVVLLEDGETVHNAFFDRGFRELRE